MKGRCVETAPAAVCAYAKTYWSAYLLSLQTTRKRCLHCLWHILLRQKGGTCSPARVCMLAVLCCFRCIATILFSRMWMQYFFALFTRHERNKQLARAHVCERRRRVEGGAAVTSHIHSTPSRVYLTDYSLLMVQKHLPQFSLCFCCSHHCPRTV